MQSNMKTLFVDYSTVLEKEPKLIKYIGSGIAGINKETFITIIKGDITQFYEVIKKIGEGAYGKIYKVNSRKLRNKQ